MVPRRIFWMIAFAFSVFAVCDLLRDIGPMQTTDLCQATCPCDAVSPPLETLAHSLSPVGDGVAAGASGPVVDQVIVDEDGFRNQEPTDPCPLNCPDCRCHMGHVLGAPPEVVFAVAALTPESLWLETVVGEGEGSRSDLFRPPRGFPLPALI